MSLNADKLIADAKKVAGRLRERASVTDTLLREAHFVSEQLDSLRTVHDDFEALNLVGRQQSNNQMVHAIHQEHPHLRFIQMQNRELRASLQDYQRALEHIMTKYREHTQKKILNSPVSFTYLSPNDARFNSKYVDKILEMVAVMRAAAQSDEQHYERVGREQDVLINKLMTENKGLREILQISRDFGCNAINPPTVDQASQTDDNGDGGGGDGARTSTSIENDNDSNDNDNNSLSNSNAMSTSMVAVDATTATDAILMLDDNADLHNTTVVETLGDSANEDQQQQQQHNINNNNTIDASDASLKKDVDAILGGGGLAATTTAS